MATSKKSTAKKDKQQFVVAGVIYWAHIKKPNEMSNKYQVTVKISDKDAEMISSLDVPVSGELKVGKDDKGGDLVLEGNFITAKNSFRPEIIDSKKRDLPEDMEIGNGTKARIVLSTYDWTFKAKSGVSLNLDTIQVLELVEFSRKSGRSLLDETDGFEVDKNALDESDSDDDSDDDDSSDEVPKKKNKGPY